MLSVYTLVNTVFMKMTMTRMNKLENTLIQFFKLLSKKYRQKLWFVAIRYKNNNPKKAHNLQYQGRKEMFYLTTHSTHFIYGYMVSLIWLRITQIAREETCCRHIGYSLRLAARVLLYESSHRYDNTYHGIC